MRWGKAMGAGEPDAATSDTEAEIEGGIRALQGNELSDEEELVAEHGEDALVAGARSIADIDKIMAELQMARDYLQSEAERVRRVNGRYAHLAQTASASVKIIAENLGNWHNVENVSQHAASAISVAKRNQPQDGNANP
jgi:hypothetical protein